MNTPLQNVKNAPMTTSAGIGGIFANIINLIIGQGFPSTFVGYLSFLASTGISILSVFSRI